MSTRRMVMMCAAFVCLSRFAPAVADGNPPEGRRIALSGYDPVSYFEDGQPAKGAREFWYAFDDVVYLFRSREHRDKFAADPERFAPQYDGYCAAAMSRGHKTEPDPEAWIVANGRLFVFQFKDRVPMFRKMIDEVATKANENWTNMKAK